jgi:uronate dehydrogenase
MMHSWISARDLTELIRCALYTPEVGHTIVYGMSNNKKVWWNNKLAAHLNFIAQDSSEDFRDLIEQQPMPAATDAVSMYQGGVYTTAGPYDDER